MRLDSTLNLRRIGGKYMIVKAVGGKANMTDVITLNETAALLWERFSDMDFTEEEMADILARGEDVDRCIRLGQDRTEADREFHAAIVRATHNSFMMRLLPMINQAVAAAIASGQHKDQLAEDTRKDHALLMDFFRKRDAAGAGHAMAIHMHHSIDVMRLGTQ